MLKDLNSRSEASLWCACGLAALQEHLHVDFLVELARKKLSLNEWGIFEVKDVFTHG